MHAHGPILTMIGGAVLAGTLVVMNVVTAANRDAAELTAAPPASPDPSATSAPPALSAPSASPVAPAKPSPRGAPPRAEYAGRTGSGMAIAIAVRDGKAVAYICDGRKVEQWLHGDDDDARVSLDGKKGAELTATRTGKKIKGRLRFRGQRLAFSASRARKPSGLYRATRAVRGVSIDGTWIVLPDGTQVGVVGRDGRTGPATPLDPSTRTTTIDGERITAAPVVP